MIQFKGCGTALVTPFQSDGSVDYQAYAKLVARQVAGGVNFLVPLATTGETPTLSVEERLELLRLTRENAPGLPLLVGCGSNSVPGTLANIKALEPCWDCVDAWLVVVPFYNKPTQQGQYLYFKTVAEQAGKPVVIYNVPGRTGANMSAQTCLRLAREVPNIIGIKEASGKYSQIAEIMVDVPDDFAVLSGDDDMTLDIMENLGADGVISVASNLKPSEMSQMTSAALAGEWERARAVEDRLKPLFKACFVESNPIPAKAGLEIMGFCSATMRLPLTEATASTRATMQEALM